MKGWRFIKFNSCITFGSVNLLGDASVLTVEPRMLWFHYTMALVSSPDRSSFFIAWFTSFDYQKSSRVDLMSISIIVSFLQSANGTHQHNNHVVSVNKTFSFVRFVVQIFTPRTAKRIKFDEYNLRESDVNGSDLNIVLARQNNSIRNMISTNNKRACSGDLLYWRLRSS